MSALWKQSGQLILFAPNKKAATWENGPKALIEVNCAVRRIRQFDHGLAANLHKLLFSSNWLLLV